jgi:PAS domain-containing protein
MVAAASAIVMFLGIVISIIDLMRSNSDFSKLVYWVDLGKSRQYSYFQSLRLGFQSFILLFFPQYKFSTFEDSLISFLSSTRLLMDGHTLLLFDISRSSLSSSQAYESIRFSENEMIDLDISTLDQFLMYYFYAVNDLLVELNRTYSSHDHSFSSSLNYSFHLFYTIGTNYLYKLLNIAYSTISGDFDVNVESFQRRILVYWMIILSIESLLFLIVMFFNVRVQKGYQTFKALFRRINPISLFNSPRTFDLISQKSKNDSQEKIGIYELAFKYNHQSIFILNSENEIMFANISATKLFGYSKEQFFHQRLSLIIPDESFLHQLSRSFQMATTRQVTGRDNDRKDLSLTINTCVHGKEKILIISDQTKIEFLRSQIETQHIKIEKLTNQLLPKQLLSMIPKDEESISFSSQSMTCVLFEYTLFSQSVVSMKEERIRTVFEQIETEFHSKLSRYKSFIRIDFSGDFDLVVGGIMDNNNSSVVKAALDFAIEWCEFITHFFPEVGLTSGIKGVIVSGGRAVLNVQVGDNAGFLIIGDPIDIVSRIVLNTQFEGIFICQQSIELLSDDSYAFSDPVDVQIRPEKQITVWQLKPLG